MIGKFITGFVILLTALAFPLTATAQNETPTITITESLEATEGAMTKQQEPEYTLPYPGILPDNPLYSVKMLRDRLVAFLIADPLKKAEFNLLQADKRLSSAMFLMDKGGEEKVSLAEETVAKGTNYAEEAMQKTREAEKQGLDAAGMQHRLVASLKKHRQVMKGFIQKAQGQYKQKFQSIDKRLEKLQAEVKTL